MDDRENTAWAYMADIYRRGYVIQIYEQQKEWYI